MATTNSSSNLSLNSSLLDLANDHALIAYDRDSLGVSVERREFPNPRTRRNSHVMIVDDEQLNIDIVQAYLEEQGFSNFTTTTDSTRVVDQIQSQPPDILLLDIRMPEVSGMDILRTLRKDKDLLEIPVIILTSASESQTKLDALRLGASDFLSKPVDPSELLLRLENVLAAKSLRDHLQDYSERLELQVMLRTSELVESRQEALLCLARAGEYRDDDTGQHVFRVGRYAAIIANQLGFPEAAVELLEQAARLHDIGKIGIPDSILRKPAQLEPEEFERMKQHCMIGCQIIDPLAFCPKTNPEMDFKKMSKSKTNSPVLKLASMIAISHHEKWDGSGYPFGLKGDDIPIEGRIVAVADVFDAVSSKRPYKRAFTAEESYEIIHDGRGTHFDPKIVDAFFARQDEIANVPNSLSNAERPNNA